ncbi:carbohydrate sulfotransferase 3-like [Glandiceps talaboti]
MKISTGLLIIFILSFCVVVVDRGLIHFYGNSLVNWPIRQHTQSTAIQDLCLCCNQSTFEQTNTTVSIKQQDNKTKPKPTNGANVLIIAGVRTGSSFAGNFFASNPQFFYLFEPLWSIRRISSGPKMSVDGVNLLRKFYKCDFGPYSDSWKTYFNWARTSSPLATKECRRVVHRNAGICCRKKTNRVAKIVRILDVRDLIPLMENPDLNLKVINVVRDPRSMMPSLMSAYYSHWREGKNERNMVRDIDHLDGHLTDSLKQYCEVMLRNYILFNSNNKEAWKANFLFLRFEDIALNPKKYADIMYSHVGIDVSKDVYRWIDSNTKVEKHERGGYSTKKNSSKVVNDWRDHVTFNLVEKIQNYTICEQYMQQLHYSFVSNVSTLNEKTLPLLTPL